jgi:hypothetical protein
MLRRALLGFLPALLALAFLFGTPATGIDAPEAAVSSWKITDAHRAVARGHLIEDDNDGSASQSADEDDSPDDRIVRVVTAIIWPQSALDPSVLVSNTVGPSHPPCAAPPRAPPAA